MAFKTIEFDASESVASLTELPRRVDRNELPAGIRLNMALNASNQTMPRATNTVMHGQIPLMSQEMEMVFPHNLSRFDTIFALPTREFGQVEVGSHAATKPQQGNPDQHSTG